MVYLYQNRVISGDVSEIEIAVKDEYIIHQLTRLNKENEIKKEYNLFFEKY